MSTRSELAVALLAEEIFQFQTASPARIRKGKSLMKTNKITREIDKSVLC